MSRRRPARWHWSANARPCMPRPEQCPTASAAGEAKIYAAPERCPWGRQVSARSQQLFLAVSRSTTARRPVLLYKYKSAALGDNRAGGGGNRNNAHQTRRVTTERLT